MARSNATSVNAETELWHSFIQTCRTIPATDTTRLAELDRVYPKLNGHNNYPKALEREWDAHGQRYLEQFELEAGVSETQEEILRKAEDTLIRLIAIKGGGADGPVTGGSSTANDGTRDTKRKRKHSPVQPLRLSDLSSAGHNIAGLANSHSARLSPALSHRANSPYPTSTRSMSPMPHGPHSALQPSSSSHLNITRDWAKKRKEAQLPLRVGRKVLYKPTNKGQGSGGGSLALAAAANASATSPGNHHAGGTGSDKAAAENTMPTEDYMLVMVTTTIGGSKERYTVRDIDDQQNSPVTYNTTIKSLHLLPDPSAPPDSPSHPNAYADYPVGSIVLALYPETTVFYRAIVVTAPIPGTACGSPVADPGPAPLKGQYRLHFDDDHSPYIVVDYDMVFDPMDHK